MFNQNPYQQMNRGFRGQPAPAYNQFVPTTNKTFVTSLEDALSRRADYNSQMVYFDANKDVMYDICTNGYGEKSWAIFNISMNSPVTDAAAVSNTPTNYEERLSTLEKKMEDILNGKHNVKQTTAVNE